MKTKTKTSGIRALALIAFVAPLTFAAAEEASAPPAPTTTTPAVTPAATPTAVWDAALIEKAEQAAERGLDYLRGSRAENGSWSDSVGVTALALRALLEKPRGDKEAEAAFVGRSVEFLLAHVNPDGSISETNHNLNYNTAVAMVALAATDNPEHAPVIEKAKAFLKGLQVDEGEGYEPDHKYYGGIGYGGDERPDLSNIYMAIEALKAADVAADDPVWEKALVFVSRSQNNTETNDLSLGGNDGGFAYMPGYSPHGEAVSYGGMTSAGLLSLLFAGADKADPRVKAAYDWIRANYTLETNPGAKENQGLFYYYNAFAKAMAAYGEPEVIDTEGKAHDWRADLAGKLISLQREDGSWVNEGSKRWWEGDPNLCTAWSLIALNHALQK